MGIDYNKKSIETIINSYENNCDLIATMFCLKYEFTNEGWVADQQGTVLMASDYFFNMEDIILSLKYDVDIDDMFEYYDYALNIGMNNSNNNDKDKDEPIINYYTWLKINNLRKLT